MIVLIMVIACCILCAACLKQRSVEEIIPITFLSVIVFLFPFYSLNILVVGKIILYCVLAGVCIWSLIRVIRNWSEVKGKLLSPGLIIFCFICVVIVILSQNRYVSLWDETRLWGALPKAIWSTEKLQLGETSLMYPSMQSYPPGIQLLIYFLMSLNSSFREWEVFAIYGIFTASLLLPALKELRWRQWPLFLPIAFVIILLPCVLTSNNEQAAFFYYTLYIDPVLGAVAGYALYFSAKDRLKDGFAIYHLSVALIVLMLLKHSGMMFAVVIFLNAFLLQILDQKKLFTKKTPLQMIPIAVLCAAYFAWQLLLGLYGVSNYAGLTEEITGEAVANMLYSMCTNAMIEFKVIRIPFLVCVVIGVIIDIFMTRKFKDLEGKTAWITGMNMTLAAVLFGLGYIKVFGNTGRSLSSFERYLETITIGIFYYLALRCISVLIRKMFFNESVVKRKRIVRGIGCIVIAMIGGMLLVFWRIRVTIGRAPIEVAAVHAEMIEKSAALTKSASDKTVADCYLLYPGDPAAISMLHQRVYFDLIGSGIRIKNTFHDAQIPGDENEKAELQNWESNIFSDYDYVYVLTTDPATDEAFKQITGSAAREKTLYSVDPAKQTFSLIEQ